MLLRESYREGGKVKNRTLANLSSWPEAKVEALAAALRGQAPATGLRGAFEISRSLPHGHVAAVLGTIRSLGVEELISPIPSRQRDLVTAMITAADTLGLSVQPAHEQTGSDKAVMERTFGSINKAARRPDRDPDGQRRGQNLVA